MRAALLVLMLALVPATGARGDSVPWTHTRPTSPAATHLLRQDAPDARVLAHLARAGVPFV